MGDKYREEMCMFGEAYCGISRVHRDSKVG